MTAKLLKTFTIVWISLTVLALAAVSVFPALVR